MTDATNKPRITIVGLGPAGPDLVTVGTMRHIDEHQHRFLRTGRHPAASLLDGAPTFDHVYEQSGTVPEVYERIAAELKLAAELHGRVLYAVPGSPVVAERSVELLMADGRLEIVLAPALSFVDLAWNRLGVDPVALGARIVDGHRFELEAAAERGPLLVAQCDSTDVLSAVKLAIADALETRSGFAKAQIDPLVITVVQRLGLEDEKIFDVEWHELDRLVEPDHLTSLWIPSNAPPVAMEVQRFVELVSTLRKECPWDREQTHESLRRHVLEETYELLDALDHLDVENGEGFDHLEEELGDLLFQIVFHATLAAEQGQFNLADVARTVHDKLHGRHPHVFGEVAAPHADQVAANWEQIKKHEKGRESVFDGIPEALPALLFALKIQKKAAALALGSTAGDSGGGQGVAIGVEDLWSTDLDMLLSRARIEADADAIGEFLFAAVDLSRQFGIDPESALRSISVGLRDAARRIEG